MAKNLHEYACAGLQVFVAFDPGQAHVIINHYSYILTLEPSDSGSYYYGDILSFWDRGKTAMLVYSGDRTLDCLRLEQP
ncbi:MliC family protein [Marinomonas aquimarina]|uniref:MliC family protein n=1 Tax=Marinomonas aquimarina TaxID=295068 RepID=UPI0018D433BA|nr:MliC family protein [Marinomonas aquimarina]